MAKMKVHELAKELDIQSKDITAFLQSKGYEIKAAQSGLEDEHIDLVKKEFGAKAAKADAAEKPKKAAKPAEEKEAPAAKKEAAPAAKKEAAPAVKKRLHLHRLKAPRVLP